QLLPPILARNIVIAVPAARAAELVRGLDAPLVQALSGIRSAPLVSVNLAFATSDFTSDVPRGYGMVTPHCQGSRLLGTLFSSSAFDDFSPPDRVLFRVLAGGSRDPDASALSDAGLVEM